MIQLDSALKMVDYNNKVQGNSNSVMRAQSVSPNKHKNKNAADAQALEDMLEQTSLNSHHINLSAH